MKTTLDGKGAQPTTYGGLCIIVVVPSSNLALNIRSRLNEMTTPVFREILVVALEVSILFLWNYFSQLRFFG